MVLSRALLLKGLAGVAAVGTVGGVGITYGKDIGNLFKSKEQLEKEKKDGERKIVNGRLGSLGLEECSLGEQEDPFVFSKECPIGDEAKLKAINFSNKGEKELIVKPSTGTFPTNLKLKVERKDKEDISFSFTGIATGSDLKLYGDKGKIVVKGEQKFKEEGGRLTKDSTVDQTLKGFNDQLEKVNAPLECRFDETEKETFVECPIKENELKVLKFSNKGEGDLKVKDWPSNVTVKLKAEKEATSPNTISFSFKEITETGVKLFGDKGKIVIKSNPETKFKVENGLLTKSAKVDATLKSFNEELSKINAPVECRFDETNANEATVECPITADELKVMEFSNKGEKELKVKDWPTGGGNIKLKVEKDNASPSTISLSLTGITGSEVKVFGDKGKIAIKSSSPEDKFKVKGGVLTKESAAAVDEDLKKFNEKLSKVNAPVECRFDDTNASEESVVCDVTKEDLKTMKFSEDGGELTYSPDSSDFSGMKLEVKVETVKDENSIDKKDFYLIFKDFSETVKLSKGGQEMVYLVKDTNPEFVMDEEDNFLEKMWDTHSIKRLLKMSCTNVVGGRAGECRIDETSSKVNVKKTNIDDFSEVEVDSIESNTLEFHKDQETFNQGYKFVFKGKTVLASDNSATLEENGEYEFKWKLKDKVRVGYLSKKS